MGVRTPTTGQQTFKLGTNTQLDAVCSRFLLTLHEHRTIYSYDLAPLHKSPLYRTVLTLCSDTGRENGSRI
jgi:hypothetical protein